MSEYGVLVNFVEHTGGAPPVVEHLGFFTNVDELCKAVLKAKAEAAPGWSVEMVPLAINRQQAVAVVATEETGVDKDGHVVQIGDRVMVVDYCNHVHRGKIGKVTEFCNNGMIADFGDNLSLCLFGSEVELVEALPS